MDSNYEIKETNLSRVRMVVPFCRDDVRGSFFKTYSGSLTVVDGEQYQIRELFFTVSKKNVVRAIHFQLGKQQPKLVQCVKGKIYDVVVDLDPNSATYGKWQSFELNDQEKIALYIPPFHGHGYYVLEDSVVCYMCGEEFFPQGDSGIFWKDSDLDITWPDGEVILSDKDKHLMSFKEYDKMIRKT